MTRKALPLHSAGFTYLFLLFAVAIMGVALTATSTYRHITQQREKERQLLHVGHQFRLAIERYYTQSPGTVKKYPRNFDELLKDNRFLNTQRHLRRIYRDPMTGKKDWGIVTAPDGGIMGVHSLSADQPLKISGFDDADKAFTGKKQYADWKFVYLPPATGTMK